MPGTQHTAQLICNKDSSVSSDIMSNIDLAKAKAAATVNYQTKFNGKPAWKSAWGTFQNLLNNSTFKTS